MGEQDLMDLALFVESMCKKIIKQEIESRSILSDVVGEVISVNTTNNTAEIKLRGNTNSASYPFDSGLLTSSDVGDEVYVRLRGTLSRGYISRKK